MFSSDINLNVPPEFRDRFLWTPPFNGASGLPADGESIDNSSSTRPFAYKFSKEMVDDAIAVTSLAFFRQAGALALDPKSITNFHEPSITLFSPFEGCHEIIDSMVKVLAERLSADVLVLDALELAKGEFGALGKGVLLFGYYADNYKLK